MAAGSVHPSLDPSLHWRGVESPLSSPQRCSGLNPRGGLTEAWSPDGPGYAAGPQRLEGRQWSSRRGGTAGLQHPEPRKQDLPPYRGHSTSSQSLPTLSNNASTPSTSARLRTQPSTSPVPPLSAPLWGHMHVNAQGTARARGPPLQMGAPIPHGFLVSLWLPAGIQSLKERHRIHAPASMGKRPPTAQQEQVQSSGNHLKHFISMAAAAPCPVPVPAGPESYTVG